MVSTIILAAHLITGSCIPGFYCGARPYRAYMVEYYDPRRSRIVSYYVWVNPKTGKSKMEEAKLKIDPAYKAWARKRDRDLKRAIDAK